MYEGYIKVDISTIEPYEPYQVVYQEILEDDYNKLRVIYYNDGVKYTDFIHIGDTNELFMREISEAEYNNL